MKQYIDKSIVMAEFNRLIAELIEEGEYTMFEQGRISAFEDAKLFLDSLETTEADLEREKVENIKKQCPFREVVCNKYQNHPLKCGGACGWVVDHLNLKTQKGE